MLKVKKVSKEFKKRIKTGSKFRDFLYPKFEPFKALDNISFDIKAGEKVAFIGPNGAGKSTSIKAILGILHYSSGEIKLMGKDPKKHRKILAKDTASVFGQRSQLLYHLPLIDSFKFFQIIYEIPDKIFRERLDYLSSRFKINEFINQPVRKLSLGQRMKGEIIASLLHNPKIIFLDEPTVGLDFVAKKVMYEILLDINKRENLTIFLTSHDINDIEALCDRGIIINEGMILYDNSLDSLMRTYANKKTIKYKEVHSVDWETIEINNEAKVIEKTVKHLFENKEIEDLQIENIPLEEIIEQFY